MLNIKDANGIEISLGDFVLAPCVSPFERDKEELAERWIFVVARSDEPMPWWRNSFWLWHKAPVDTVCTCVYLADLHGSYYSTCIDFFERDEKGRLKNVKVLRNGNDPLPDYVYDGEYAMWLDNPERLIEWRKWCNRHSGGLKISYPDPEKFDPRWKDLTRAAGGS